MRKPKKQAEWQAHDGEILALDCWPRGNVLGSASYYARGDDEGTQVRLWDLTSGRLLADLAPLGEQDSAEDAGPPLQAFVAFSGGGRWLCVADDEGTIRLYSPRTATEEVRFPTDETGIDAVVFSDRDRVLTVGGRGGTVRNWDIASGRRTYELDLFQMRDFAFARTGKLMATTWGHRVAVWRLDTRQYLALLRLTDTCRAYRFSGDGRHLATSASDGKLTVWSTRSFAALAELGLPAPAMCVGFSRDDALLAAGLVDGTWKLWDARTFRTVATVAAYPDNAVYRLAFGGDGKCLATAGESGEITVYRLG
jgi:WD40 repeat protein